MAAGCRIRASGRRLESRAISGTGSVVGRDVRASAHPAGGARLDVDVQRREETDVEQGPWFFCLKHHTVEDRDGCAERHRLGPFATRSEAEHALEKVAERNEAADAADRAWEEGRR
jgi:hypothetical protein